MKVALAKQMHEIDKSAIEEYGLPELSLMESAGHRVFEAVRNLLNGVGKKSVCILAGSGNNGGDALTAARYLANSGARVKIFLLGDKDHRTASLNVQMRILRGMGVAATGLGNACKSRCAFRTRSSTGFWARASAGNCAPVLFA